MRVIIYDEDLGHAEAISLYGVSARRERRVVHFVEFCVDAEA